MVSIITTHKSNNISWLFKLIRTKQKNDQGRLRTMVLKWKELCTPSLQDILDLKKYVKEELQVDLKYSEAEGFIKK